MKRNPVHLLMSLAVLAVCLAVIAQDSPPQAAAQTTPEPTPSLTPSATLPLVPQLESPTPTETPGPPTATYTPSPTLGPFEHTIRENETLLYIIQLYGYRDLSVIDLVVALNPNIPNADSLPGPGNVILIPRPTPTATPEGFVPTELPPGFTPDVDNLGQPQLLEHTVREGETIVGIAGQYETTLEVLDQLNPELVFINCDFTNPSGGPECNVPLSVDQVVSVPAPTPTPTLSPTPSGNETATPTPTFTAPLIVFPPENAIAPPRPITLQWVSVGILPPDHVYLIQVEDTTAGTPAQIAGVTRDTSLTLGTEWIPSDGQTHTIRWRVLIGAPNESGAYRMVISEPEWRTLQWQSS